MSSFTPSQQKAYAYVLQKYSARPTVAAWPNVRYVLPAGDIVERHIVEITGEFRRDTGEGTPATIDPFTGKKLAPGQAIPTSPPETSEQ